VAAAVLLLALAAPPPPACRESRITAAVEAGDDGVRRRTHREDVDGDGRDDVLALEDSSGSGGGLVEATLTLSGGRTLRASVEYSFSMLLDVLEVPEALRDPRDGKALDLQEEALFGAACPAPDPSLDWLLRTDKRLVWIEGPPVLPQTYVVRRPGAPVGRTRPEWVYYKGHTHAYDLGRGPNPPQELARSGTRVLVGTSHGVILTDPGRTRHAWIYVATPPHRLRFPSVLGARIVGDAAVITLTSGDGEFPAAARRTVRVDLATGAVR
jgi:hypothetical protein